jgi:hypothetical protein
MADYKYLVEMWDAADRRWVPDGDLAYAVGFVMRHDGTPRALAAQILRNWTGEAGNSAAGRWRATVWDYEPGKALRDPAASAVRTVPLEG